MTTQYYSDQYQQDKRRVRVVDNRDFTAYKGSSSGFYSDQQCLDGRRFKVDAGSHDMAAFKGAGSVDKDHSNGKVTFYFANIPDCMPLFRLRQFFEVCGILSDIYVARKLNYRGQVYGFVRFENVRNIEKLASALNNVWIGDHRVWAREARFDRFAQFDVLNKNVVREGRSFGRKEGGSPVVITHREGVKNVRVSKATEEERGREVVDLVKVGTVEVRVGKKEEKNKLKKSIEGKAKGEVGKKIKVISKEKALEGKVLGRIGKKGVDGMKVLTQKEKSNVEKDVTLKVNLAANMLLYHSNPADSLWAFGGMVATVVSGDSSLSLQQRVEDADFLNVIVTPLGSDKVFLHCLGDEDVWKVFNDAIHFFGMLFFDLHKWTLEDAIFERGAWLWICGTPLHAWNEMFFKICVSQCGRFIRADDCTVDKVRLDFARVLVSTTSLEVVNSLSEVVIDGRVHSVKLVEEWGCNLGEDAFLSEEEMVPSVEVLSNHNEEPIMEEVQGELEDLVEDLNKAWSLQDEIKGGSGDGIENSKQFDEISAAKVMLEKLDNNAAACSNNKGGKVGHGESSKVKKSTSSKHKKNKTGVALKQPVTFFKRIARLPLKDRKEILKVLKKQERKRRRQSKGSKALVHSLSNSSHTSNSSVNKDWENSVVLHGNKNLAREDVREVGVSLGVTFKGSKNESCNLLTREGRKEWRAGRGSVFMEGELGDGRPSGEGV